MAGVNHSIAHVAREQVLGLHEKRAVDCGGVGDGGDGCAAHWALWLAQLRFQQTALVEIVPAARFGDACRLFGLSVCVIVIFCIITTHASSASASASASSLHVSVAL